MEIVGKIKRKVSNVIHFRRNFRLLNERVYNLETEHEEILDGYNILFNNLYLFHDITPKPLLVKSHQLILEMLDFIDNVCRKHDIQWFLCAGSLLGAYRHGGFIPWDDDCDIMMLRNDYEKFVDVIAEELEINGIDKYVIMKNSVMVGGYIMRFTKLDYKVGRQFIGFVDVFPFDYIEKVDDDLFERYLEVRRRFSYALIDGGDRRELLKDVFKELNLTTERTDYLVTSVEDSENTFGVFKTDEIFPLSEIAFEDQTYPCPKNNAHFLEVCYGDFMRLPKKVEAHGMHQRLFETENIEEILDEHIAFLKQANENFK